MNFKLYCQFTIQRRYQWPDTGCVFTPYCIPLHCGIFKVCSQRLWDKTVVQATFGALEEQYCRLSFNSCKMSTWSSMVQYNLNHSGCTHPGSNYLLVDIWIGSFCHKLILLHVMFSCFDQCFLFKLTSNFTLLTSCSNERKEKNIFPSFHDLFFQFHSNLKHSFAN